MSLSCTDNDVAEHPGTSETESKDISPLIEGFIIGDANEAFVEDGGEENNSTKMAPLDSEKRIFHQPSLIFASSPTKIMNHMKMGTILMESLFTLMNMLRWEKILTCLLRLDYVMVLQRCWNQRQQPKQLHLMLLWQWQ